MTFALGMLTGAVISLLSIWLILRQMASRDVTEVPQQRRYGIQPGDYTITKPLKEGWSKKGGRNTTPTQARPRKPEGMGVRNVRKERGE